LDDESYALVQPYGTGRHRDDYRRATVLSIHTTADEAFAALDRIAQQLRAHGLDEATITVVIVDECRRPVTRVVDEGDAGTGVVDVDV
jgi:hypothetical protein